MNSLAKSLKTKLKVNIAPLSSPLPIPVFNFQKTLEEHMPAVSVEITNHGRLCSKSQQGFSPKDLTEMKTRSMHLFDTALGRSRGASF